MHTRLMTCALLLALAVGDLAIPAGIVRVSAGDDLQRALDAARPGDTILVEAGATFVGNFVLPRKDGDAFITVRSSAAEADLPASGHRVRPADTPALAHLRSPNGDPVIRTAPGAHHWRLQFLELGPTAGGRSDIVALGDGSSRQHRLDQVPHDLEIDRCYIHGDLDRGQRRGIALNSASTRIVDSHISGIAAAGVDSQAIAGWNGPGPFEVSNTYLEAAGENMMLGGGDPSIPGLVPSDLTFRGNHVTKPLAWRGSRWDVKNLFELKNARRVLVEGNVFEHNWEAAQPGPAIVFTPRNQDGGAPWSGVEDVVFRGNVVRHVAAGFNILGHDNNAPSRQTARIAIENNLLYDVDADQWGGNGVFLLIGDGPSDIRVSHNTVVHSGNVISAYGRPTTGFVFRDNLIRHNRYGIKGDGQGVGLDSLEAYFPGASVTGNVIAGADASRYPEDNFFPSLAEWQAQFEDFARGELALAGSSRYRRSATDDTAVGADVAAIREVIARAIDGGRGARAVRRPPPPR